MGTVGATSKVTAEHYSTKSAHPVIVTVLQAKCYRDIEVGKMIQFVVYLVQPIN